MRFSQGEGIWQYENSKKNRNNREEYGANNWNYLT
jgi:hypothetical protein